VLTLTLLITSHKKKAATAAKLIRSYHYNNKIHQTITKKNKKNPLKRKISPDQLTFLERSLKISSLSANVIITLR